MVRIIIAVAILIQTITTAFGQQKCDFAGLSKSVSISTKGYIESSAVSENGDLYILINDHNSHVIQKYNSALEKTAERQIEGRFNHVGGEIINDELVLSLFKVSGRNGQLFYQVFDLDLSKETVALTLIDKMKFGPTRYIYNGSLVDRNSPDNMTKLIMKIKPFCYKNDFENTYYTLNRKMEKIDAGSYTIDHQVGLLRYSSILFDNEGRILQLFSRAPADYTKENIYDFPLGYYLKITNSKTGETNEYKLANERGEYPRAMMSMKIKPDFFPDPDPGMLMRSIAFKLLPENKIVIAGNISHDEKHPDASYLTVFDLNRNVFEFTTVTPFKESLYNQDNELANTDAKFFTECVNEVFVLESGYLQISEEMFFNSSEYGTDFIRANLILSFYDFSGKNIWQKRISKSTKARGFEYDHGYNTIQNADKLIIYYYDENVLNFVEILPDGSVSKSVISETLADGKGFSMLKSISISKTETIIPFSGADTKEIILKKLVISE